MSVIGSKGLTASSFPRCFIGNLLASEGEEIPDKGMTNVGHWFEGTNFFVVPKVFYWEPDSF
ncbi:hypothetical protein [Vibrio breoganii]|uniref:Uncharacterized protein n=1 Tax=Vibrio breoganii TaxID=553239 RepID=A0AAP8MUV0_9VIBR|nr:hypothetical protein [Vibrio breoganii]PMM17153.1 hypothetical protein BCT59_14535 [Vibrio breoganii]PMP09094.1 hypothetical protein BCS93_13285 [Vibrio breoganii]